jgi:hypothetical protein
VKLAQLRGGLHSASSSSSSSAAVASFRARPPSGTPFPPRNQTSATIISHSDAPLTQPSFGFDASSVAAQEETNVGKGDESAATWGGGYTDGGGGGGGGGDGSGGDGDGGGEVVGGDGSLVEACGVGPVVGPIRPTTAQILSAVVEDGRDDDALLLRASRGEPLFDPEATWGGEPGTVEQTVVGERGVSAESQQSLEMNTTTATVAVATTTVVVAGEEGKMSEGGADASTLEGENNEEWEAVWGRLHGEQTNEQRDTKEGHEEGAAGFDVGVDGAAGDGLCGGGGVMDFTDERQVGGEDDEDEDQVQDDGEDDNEYVREEEEEEEEEVVGDEVEDGDQGEEGGDFVDFDEGVAVEDEDGARDVDYDENEDDEDEEDEGDDVEEEKRENEEDGEDGEEEVGEEKGGSVEDSQGDMDEGENERKEGLAAAGERPPTAPLLALIHPDAATTDEKAVRAIETLLGVDDNSSGSNNNNNNNSTEEAIERQQQRQGLREALLVSSRTFKSRLVDVAPEAAAETKAETKSSEAKGGRTWGNLAAASATRQSSSSSSDVFASLSGVASHLVLAARARKRIAERLAEREVVLRERPLADRAIFDKVITVPQLNTALDGSRGGSVMSRHRMTARVEAGALVIEVHPALPEKPSYAQRYVPLDCTGCSGTHRG